jgi:hypothetical protein
VICYSEIICKVKKNVALKADYLPNHFFVLQVYDKNLFYEKAADHSFSPK